MGEPYHIEFAFNLWNPEPSIVIASESLGIPGTDINVRADLGVEKKMTYEFRLVLRPGRKHKFRFNYIPLKYDADTTLTGEIIFNGIKFPVNTQVGTLLEWKTYRIGYEYDFLSKPRWFVGCDPRGQVHRHQLRTQQHPSARSSRRPGRPSRPSASSAAPG